METPPNQQPPTGGDAPAKGKLPRAPMLAPDGDDGDGGGKRKKTILAGLLIIALLLAAATVAYNVFNTGRRGAKDNLATIHGQAGAARTSRSTGTAAARRTRENVTKTEAARSVPEKTESAPSTGRSGRGQVATGRTAAQARKAVDKADNKENTPASAGKTTEKAAPPAPKKSPAPVASPAPVEKVKSAAKRKPVPEKPTRRVARSTNADSEDKAPDASTRRVQSVYENVEIRRSSDLIDITAITESKNISASNNLFAWPGGQSAGGSKSVFEKDTNFMGKENNPAEAEFTKSKFLYMVLVQESPTPEPLRKVARKLKVMTLAPEIKKTISHGRRIYWLTVGHYTSKTSAANKAQEIRNMGFPTTVVSEKIY